MPILRSRATGTDETFTGEQIQHRLERKTVDTWIVEEDGAPVGYLQSWWETGVGSTEPAKSAGAGLAGAGAEVEPPLRGGLDGFLVPAARGRGIMPAVAHTLATDLLAQGWSYVTVDPYASNTGAIHAWQRAGFVEVSRHAADDEHTSDWVLMRFEG